MECLIGVEDSTGHHSTGQVVTCPQHLLQVIALIHEFSLDETCLLRSVMSVEQRALNRFSMYSVSSSDFGSLLL